MKKSIKAGRELGGDARPPCHQYKLIPEKYDLRGFFYGLVLGLFFFPLLVC